MNKEAAKVFFENWINVKEADNEILVKLKSGVVIHLNDPVYNYPNDFIAGLVKDNSPDLVKGRDVMLDRESVEYLQKVKK